MARVDLAGADLRQLLDFATLTREVGWSDTDLRPLLDGVAGLVPCDFVTITLIHPDPAQAWCSASTPSPMTADLFDAFTRYADDHPYVQSLAQIEHRQPARLSDLASVARFRQTALYLEHFKPLGTTDQLCLAVDVRGAALVGLSLNASGRDFSDRDVEVVGQLWPHLRGALREHDRLAAVQQRLSAGGSPVAAAALTRLSPRERDVAHLVALGLADKQIGTRLSITPRTVEKHIEHILDKLDVQSRALVAVAVALAGGGLPLG